MRKLIQYTCAFGAALLAIPAYAQEMAIQGMVRDGKTKQPVPYATVHILNTTAGAATDAKGKFGITMPHHITAPRMAVSYIGYTTDTIAVTPGKRYYDILLAPAQGDLNEVVITGVSKATRVRENPVPIVAVSAKKMDRAAESNVIDALVKNVPGLNAVKTGPNISKPFIRGLGYNRVLTLYDGIRQEGQQWGDEHGIEVDAYNIEKAEVIKGPASLMYGSDALAGVVSLMSPAPDGKDRRLHGRYVSEYQSNNGLAGNGLRLTYGGNHWAYLLSGSYRIARNYTNAIDGRVYNTGFRETNISGNARYTGSRGYATVALTLYDNLQGIPDGSRDSLTRKFTRQVQEGVADDIKSRPVVPDSDLNGYTLSPLHQHIQHYRAYGSGHYETGDGSMDILLAFQQNIRREYNHPSMPAQAGMYVQLNTLNYGIKYNAPKWFNTAFTFGVNGMYQANSNKNATDFPIPDYSLLDAGAYGFAQWKYGKWTVGGGLRYDIRYLRGGDFYTQKDSVTGFAMQAPPGDRTGAYLQFPAFDKTFGGVSLSAGTTYQVNNSISLKANIAQGYRAPNMTEFASNGLDPGAHIVYLGNRNVEPELSLQEDLGAEIYRANVSASLSVFNNHIANYIYLSQQVDGNGNPVINAQGDKTYRYLQASAQLYGMEATLSIRPAFLTGFSFDNAFTMIYGTNKSSLYHNKGVEGEYLPLIPPTRLLSSAEQTLKPASRLFAEIHIKAEVDINAAQNRYMALNSTETQTPGYTLCNLAAGTGIRYAKNHMLQLEVQVNNLWDIAYQSNLSRLKYFEYYQQPAGSHSGIYNMGRNIAVKVLLGF